MTDFSEAREIDELSGQERRRRERLDPYEVLVRAPDDIVGLLAYSKFRHKKKQIFYDGSNRSNFLFFDTTAEYYSEQLRSDATKWYNELQQYIETERAEKLTKTSIEVIEVKLNELIYHNKKYPWWSSIKSNIAAFVIIAATISFLAFSTHFISLLNPINFLWDVWKWIKSSF